MGRFAFTGFFAVLLTFLVPEQVYGSTTEQCGPPLGRLAYDVLNNDDKVGEIIIDVSRKDAELAIRTKVAAVITLLSIPIYRYGHQSTELWRDGGFHSVSGWTLDAGRRYDITIAPGRKKRYRVRRNEQENEVNGILLSRMVWCRDAFAGGDVISTTTGKVRPIPVDDLGIETRAAGDASKNDIPIGPKGSHYYRFTRKDRSGYVWYGDDGIIAKVAYRTRFGTMAAFTRRSSGQNNVGADQVVGGQK